MNFFLFLVEKFLSLLAGTGIVLKADYITGAGVIEHGLRVKFPPPEVAV